MGHINPATVRLDRTLFNSTTALISDDPSRLSLVRLRNGSLVEVFRKGEDDDGSPCIRDTPFNYLWEPSGHSVTNSEYDIVELLTS